MAVIQSAATGNANVGGTWVGGVAPGVGDTFEVLSGHDVTFTADMTVLGWTQKGSGRLLLSTGVKLTATASDMIVEGDSNDVAKVVLAAGAQLLGAPGSGVTINFRLGTDYYHYAEIESRGNIGSRCKIGKAVGAAGTVDIRHGEGGLIWMNGVLDCEYTDFPGIGTTDLYPRHHGRVILRKCTVDGSFNITGYNMVAPDYIGEMKFEDTDFNGDTTLVGNGEGTPLTLTRNEFFGSLVVNWPGGGAPGTLIMHDSILHKTFGGSWPGVVDLKGCFLYHRSGDGSTGQYNFMATYKDCYAFADYRDAADQVNGGNPHFFSANSSGRTMRVEGCIIEYRGPAGPDTGDAGDLHSGSMELVNSILLPSDNVGVSSGAFWFLGGAGVIDVDHCTIHCGNSGGLRFPHNASMTAGQAKIKNSILWNDSGVSHGVTNDSPSFSDVDALQPADFTKNAMVGLSDGTNVVGGVSTVINGVSACEFSTLPTGNLTLSGSGAAFYNGDAGFLAWAASSLGLSGDADALREGALTAIRNDKTIVRLSLLPYVFSGYRTTNAALENAGTDGETIGAAGYTDGSGIEPLPWPESLDYWEAKVLPKALLWAQNMIDLKDLRVGGGGDTNTMAATYYDAIRVYQNLHDYFPGHETLFLNAANAAEYLYVDDFLVPGGFAAPGFWNFTTGLYNLWVRTGNVKHKNSLISLSVNAAFATAATGTGAAAIDFARENAYAVISHLNAEKAGATHRADTDVKIGILKDHCDMLLASDMGDPDTLQSFIVSIMGEALKMLYEASTDDAEKAELIATTQAIADYTWLDRWDAENGRFHYGVDDSQDLNLYIAPMYAWLWHKTGEIRNRDRFDTIFGFGVVGGWLDPHKQFNQQNIKIYEGINYRQIAVDIDTPTVPVDDYFLSGPGLGTINQESSDFTITLGEGEVAGTITFTPTSSAGTGSFDPATIELTNFVRSGTFTYTPTSIGIRSISAPDDAGLADPAAVSFIAEVEAAPSPIIPMPSQTFLPLFVGGRMTLVVPRD